MRELPRTDFKRLLRKAIDYGAVVKTPTSLEWDCSNGCLNPFKMTFRSQEPEKIRNSINFRYIDIITKCRKCQECRRARASSWRYRALTEFQRASRVWFCTFTVNPHHRALYALRAGSWQFLPVYREFSKDFTLYLKRLRKASGAKFKYLLVAEEHKDGFPHLHALIYERQGTVLKKQIQTEWKVGFSQARICESPTVFYVCKYITKQIVARVRASLYFGKDELTHSDLELQDEEDTWYNDPDIAKLLKRRTENAINIPNKHPEETVAQTFREDAEVTGK